MVAATKPVTKPRGYIPTVEIDGLHAVVRYWRATEPNRGVNNRSARRHLGERALTYKYAAIARPLTDGPDWWQRCRDMVRKLEAARMERAA